MQESKEGGACRCNPIPTTHPGPAGERGSVSDTNDDMNEWARLLAGAKQAVAATPYEPSAALLNERAWQESIHAEHHAKAAQARAEEAARQDHYMLATMSAYLYAHVAEFDIERSVANARAILAEVDRTEPSK